MLALLTLTGVCIFNTTVQKQISCCFQYVVHYIAFKMLKEKRKKLACLIAYFVVKTFNKWLNEFLNLTTLQCNTASGPPKAGKWCAHVCIGEKECVYMYSLFIHRLILSARQPPPPTSSFPFPSFLSFQSEVTQLTKNLNNLNFQTSFLQSTKMTLK